MEERIHTRAIFLVGLVMALAFIIPPGMIILGIILGFVMPRYVRSRYYYHAIMAALFATILSVNITVIILFILSFYNTDYPPIATFTGSDWVLFLAIIIIAFILQLGTLVLGTFLRLKFKPVTYKINAHDQQAQFTYSEDILDAIQKMHDMMEKGILTMEEFEEKKQNLLSQL